MDELTISVLVAVVAVFLVVVLFFVFRARGRKAPPIAQRDVGAVPQPSAPPEPAEEQPEVVPEVPVAPAPPKAAPLSQKLSRTRGLFGKLEKIWGSGESKALEQKQWDELEEALLEADVGFSTTTALIEKVRARVKSGDPKPMRDLMREECEALFTVIPQGPQISNPLPTKPFVVSIVGINGVGKTTTIGKVAHRFIAGGQTVLMGAGDTFRAAAISQLKVWSERVGAQFVTGREGGDPGAVAFDAVTAAKARAVDLVLLDTAGRLHTKSNLMEELKKVHRVMKKVIPEAPHETWLVVDGTLGQNSVQQAKEFQKILDLTGVIVTKLDGTAKGGAILAITSELKLPIRFIGVGESMEDLVPFDPKLYTDAILGKDGD